MASSRQIKELRALQNRKGRAETGHFLAEGVRVIEDLLDSDVEPLEFFATSSFEDNPRGLVLAHRIHRAGFDRVDLSESELRQVSSTETSQGVLAIARIPRASYEQLVEGSPELLVVLDGIQDPGNFGTLVRSAEALGIGGVVTLPGTVDPWNPKSVRAAAGSSFRLPIVEGDPAILDQLRGEGYHLLGADMNGRDVKEAAGGRIALVLGNEGAGLSDDVRAMLDDTVAVPIRGRAESLNVAAAAAILMYELLR